MSSMTPVRLLRRTVAHEVFDLERIADGSGTLYVGELARRGAGSIERFFLIASVPPGRSRGGHAHREQSEYVVAVHGRVDVRLESRGNVWFVALDRVGRTLYVPPGYWLDLFNFSDDAVLGVLSTHPFDESDHIRDRAAFLRWEAAVS